MPGISHTIFYGSDHALWNSLMSNEVSATAYFVELHTIILE